ncbi:MAG: efflux RND transporter periplasmic adaptor subunit [Alphaproteobacteria bacterium]|nr:efflux RND transporter periplasmic adaptor subunit [Alphaproteobacteria bacterium]
MNKSIITALVLAVLAVGWILTGQLAPNDANGDDEAQPVEEAAAPMKVRVADLEAMPRTETVDVTGRTEASRKVNLRSETEGQVVEIYARRGEKVSEGDPIAKLRLDDRPANLAEARATLRQREIEFRASAQLNQRGFRSETEKAAAQARLDAARAVVEQMEIDIDRTTFKAPFDGTIGAEHAEKGDYVRVGDIAAMVVDLDPMLVVGNVSERQVGKITEGMPGTVRLIDGSTHEGIVRFVASVAEPATRTYRVELEVPNTDQAIRDGLTAEIAIPVESAMAHFVTPSTLTLNDDGIVGVRTVSEDDTVVFRPVEIIADEPGGVWLGGLPERIRLITVGQEFVIDGERVTPIAGKARIAGGGDT